MHLGQNTLSCKHFFLIFIKVTDGFVHQILLKFNWQQDIVSSNFVDNHSRDLTDRTPAFVNHSKDYRRNWTLSTIIMMKQSVEGSLQSQ